MPTYRAQVIIPHGNALPKDGMTNTFHFIDFVPQPLADLADDVTPLMETLYEAIYAAASRANICYNWAATSVHWYDLAQPTPRVPYILPMPLTLTAVTAAIPSEAAVVASFQAPRAPGVPQSRRRGRIYLGGLGSSWFSQSTSTSEARVAPGPISSTTAAFSAFRSAVAGTSARWAVWSPTDQAAYTITNGWVENAIDTQRRRGSEATTRTTWS